jgi:hypothetical protein
MAANGSIPPELAGFDEDFIRVRKAEVLSYTQ